VFGGAGAKEKGLKAKCLHFARGELAGYRRPKGVDFIGDEEMPRTATGKILHRVLKHRYGTWSDEPY
jgi:acyl-coenzyme A synthetase/AMP-(fatty) acid ligase